MELTFVDDSEVKSKAGRKEKYPWGEVISIVKANPGKWARLPFTTTNASSGYHQARKHEGLQVICKKSENDWIVFMRFTPPEN